MRLIGMCEGVFMLAYACDKSICSRSTLLVSNRQHQPVYSLCDKHMLLLLLKLDIMSKIVFGSNLHSPPITTLH